MSETKPVIWSRDGKKANDFFFRSPFRSWRFLINTLLLVGVVLAYVIVAWECLGTNRRIILLIFMLSNVVYPYWGALLRHRKINALYRADKITVQPPESPVDDLLEVADDAINEGLRNSSFVFGIVLLVVALSRGHLR